MNRIAEREAEGHPVMLLMAMIIIPWGAVFLLGATLYCFIIPMVLELIRGMFGG